MKAKIINIFSTDIEEPLSKFKPKINDNFGFNLRMIIGTENNEGEESFDIMLCTPKWLMENFKKEEIIFGRHYLIVFLYDYQSIYKKLTEYVNSIDAKTWDEIGLLIGRIGHWEFEDYESSK